MTKQEARVWIDEHTEAAREIAKYIANYYRANSNALADLRYDRLASYFESKAVETYMDNGGDDDFIAVHAISSLYREIHQSEQVAIS